MKTPATPHLHGFINPLARTNTDSFIGVWLVQGETGISSKAMAAVAMGRQPDPTWKHSNWPHDPADLNRCIKLVKAAPEVRKAFPKIADLSPQWGAIIRNWDLLVDTFHGEAGEDWKLNRAAPATYKMMQALFEEVKR